MLPSTQLCLGDSFTSTDLSFMIMSCLLDCWGPAAVVTASLQSLPLILERGKAERKAGNLDTRDKRVRLRQAKGERQNCRSRARGITASLELSPLI